MGHDVLAEWNSIASELHIPEHDPGEVVKLHVYDFDNTLFYSPVPNPQLYTKTFETRLRSDPELSSFGGWWDDPRPVEVVNKMMVRSSQRSEFWNEDVIKLARMSWRDENTVSVILTGRKENLFSHHIARLLQTAREKWSQKEDTDENNERTSTDDLLFNAVLLKKLGQETRTVEYKQKCVLSFIDAYPNLKEISMYDDRIHQINKFESFFESLKNTKFKWSITPVAPRYHYLPMKEELALINKFIQEKNRDDPSRQLRLTRTPMQVGYFLTLSSQKKLLHWALNYLKRVIHEDKVTISNFAEYPMYIPCVAPGQKMSTSQVAKCFTKFDSIQVNKNIDNADKTPEEIIKYFCSQNVMLSEWTTSFKVTAIAFREPIDVTNLRSKKSYKPLEVYYKVVPTKSKTETWSNFGSYVVIGYNYDNNLSHQISEINLILGNAKVLDWRSVRNGIKINTYFGFFSKKDCN